jgi:L-alanine-DL-glutamate epimerase-like enolase superfamily enzyme
MLRRDFLKTLPLLPALAEIPRLRGARIKITDVQLKRTRIVRETGTVINWVGLPNKQRIGGTSFIEVHTDQGLVGLGPTAGDSEVAALKEFLNGRDPFDIERLAAELRNGSSGGGRGSAAFTPRGGASAEIAIWDIIGKATNQPLYRLWGGMSDKIVPYASQMRLGTPEERAQQAARLKAEGWQALKYRTHFPTLKEDIRLVSETRKAVGDDWKIMCDANMATTQPMADRPFSWDFRRASDTAREYQRMGVYWLEEPLPRYDYDHIAELNREVDMMLAGGESNNGLHEFRDLLERGCYDMVQPEVLNQGPTLLRKVAVLAESMNKYCVPHNGGRDIGVICCMHLVASWPNAPVLELWHDPPELDYAYGFAVFENPPKVDKEGFFHLPDAPGLGVSMNKDMLVKT